MQVRRLGAILTTRPGAGTPQKTCLLWRNVGFFVDVVYTKQIKHVLHPLKEKGRVQDCVAWFHDMIILLGRTYPPPRQP